MAEQFTNFAKTTLSAGINNSVTAIPVTDGTQFPTSDFYIVIGNASTREIVHCVSRSGNTITADLRGAKGTTATSHLSGVAVSHSVLAHHIQNAIAPRQVVLGKGIDYVGTAVNQNAIANFDFATGAIPVGTQVAPICGGGPITVEFQTIAQLSLQAAAVNTQLAARAILAIDGAAAGWLIVDQMVMPNSISPIHTIMGRLTLPNIDAGRHLFNVRVYMYNGNGGVALFGGDLGSGRPILETSITVYELI